MNRTDHAVIGGLVLLLALIAAGIGMPAFSPAAVTVTPSIPVPTQAGQLPYREGTIGRPVSVNPLAARTQVDRDLVALTFSGLVKLGADGNVVPDLASRWTVDKTGKKWTFTLRADALWHDGEPLTAADILFTVNILRDPTYSGPGAGSWREVTPLVLDAHTIQFDLATPLGGFLQLATQPIAPAHLLDGIPIESLADDPFGRRPVGSGPFSIAELDDQQAILEPAGSAAQPTTETPGASPSAGELPSDALATPAPTRRPSGAVPLLPGIEFHFFDDAASLAAAFEAGDVDAASGLSAIDAAGLATKANGRMLRYPGTTMTTVLLNLRPVHPEFRDPRVRLALLAALNRPAVIASALGGFGTQADSPIPPTSWAFDPVASARLDYDRKAAGKVLKAQGWTKVDGAWRLPKAKAPYVLQLVTPDAASNPVLHAVAERVAADWKGLGITVELVEAAPGTLYSDYLADGKFSTAVLDISIGHDPDLYPLLASSQTQTGGLNVIGLQSAPLDALLAAARKPGEMTVRKAAYSALQKQLTEGRFLFPIAFADEVVVVRDEVEGVVTQPVGDPSDRFWDVLTWRLANGR
jgi:peptide/nickel transport system substrate-binding protein